MKKTEEIKLVSRRFAAFGAVLSAVVLPLCLRATELPERDWECIELDDDHVSIESKDKSRRNSAIPVDTAGDLTVPRILGGSMVVSVGEKAFYGCTNLTSVVIPEGVTNIGDSAFYNCSSLTNVVFPTTLKSIGASAFVSCRNLKSVQIEAPRLTIGDEAFRNCDKIEEFQFDGDELIAGKRAFFGCGGLRTVDVVAKQVTLSEEVFSGGESVGYCGTLTNVAIRAAGRVEFGNSVFNHCAALRTVELPVGLVGVPENAFSYCSSLQSVSLSSNVTSIAYRAFDTCTSLKTIELSEGLRTIEAQAFFGCKVLGRLLIPQSVSTLGDRAFESCEGLGEVVFRGVSTNLYAAATVGVGVRCFYQDFALTNVVLSGRTMTFGEKAFSGCESLARIDLPTNLVDIANSLFESCAALSAIDFPVTLQTIGNSAFNSCTNLTGFLIPTNNTVAIGNKAFGNTKYWNDWPDNTLVTNRIYILGFKGNPTEVVLPDGCKAITSGMFEGMTALTNVVIPASLETVGSRAFAGSGLVRIDFSGTQLTTLGISAFNDCSNLVECVLVDGLTAIPDEAFRNCTSLMEIDIPRSVASIGVSAFRNCTSLTYVFGGDGVRSVGDFAFAGCVNLEPFRFQQEVAYGEHVFQGVRWTENVLLPSVGTLAQEYPDSYTGIVSIVISSSQTNITDGACAGCVSLVRVEVPDGVKGIGARAFEGCTALRELVLSPSVTSVGSNAVSGCTALVTLTTSGAIVFKKAFPELANTLSDIRIAKGAVDLCDEALAGCTELKKIDLPWTLESIGESAFAGCTNLYAGCTNISESLAIPDLVTSIGDLAFEGCTGLRNVRYLGGCPEAGADIYSKTIGGLVSRVLRDGEGWAQEVSGSIDGGTARWPEGDSSRSVRYMGLEGVDKVSFAYYNGTSDCKNRFFISGSGASIEELPDDPEREGYEFLGWFTKPYGGEEIEVPFAVTRSVTIYAHWERTSGGGGGDDPEVWDGESYDADRAHVYDGYLTDGATVAGTIQVKAAKGKTSKKTEETTVSLTAKVLILGEGKSISFKGTAEDVDESGGSCDLACSTKSDKRVLSVSFEGGELEGSLDGYDVVAVRSPFSGTSDEDRRTALAAKDDWGSPRVVVLRASGDSPMANGYATLSVKPGTKGKVRVSGMLPDGTKVSTSAQMMLGEDSCEIPVVAPLYTKKAGGFAFLIQLSREDDPAVTGLSDWIGNPGKEGEFTASLEPVGGESDAGIGRGGRLLSDSLFSLEEDFDAEDVDIETDLLPNGLPISVAGSKWTLPKGDENPSELKLTYSTDGTFKGSFKVYAVTDAGKSKKYTANVTGVVLDGAGFGTAAIKKVASVPVFIEAE